MQVSKYLKKDNKQIIFTMDSNSNDAVVKMLRDQVMAFRLLCHGNIVPAHLVDLISATALSAGAMTPHHFEPTDLNEVQAEISRFVEQQLRQREQAVRLTLSSGYLPPHDRMNASLDLKAAQSLHAQRRVRATLENISIGKPFVLRETAMISDPLSMLPGLSDPFQVLNSSLGRGLARRTRPVDARSETVAAVFEQIPSHFERFTAFHRSRREEISRLSIPIATAVAARERRRNELQDRAERERVKLLKSKNYEEYVALLKETKNTRLTELIDQTDKFLQEIGLKVQVQKADTRANLRRLGESTQKDQNVEENTGTNDVTGYMDYYGSVHRVREDVHQPACLSGGTLMPYQIAGLQWLVSLYNNKLHGILADEMGLGKTVQTIALLAYLAEVKANPGPHLIIVPLSTLPNWTSEFERWLPSFNVLVFKGSKTERRSLGSVLKGESGVNVCLTTYDFVLREKGLLASRPWRHVIVDEGHRMKNAKGKLHAILASFRCANRLLLTGTPLQNNLTELWALLNFLLPRIFQSSDDFEQWFSAPFSRVGDGDASAAALNEEEQLLVIHRLHVVLRPFLLRRIKSEVLTDLPDKQEFVVRVELSAWQRLQYDRLTESAISVLSADGTVSNKKLHNSMMQLRKTANHPFLFLDEYRLDGDIVRVSGKFEVLDRMLPKLVDTGHKVLIFSQMTSLLDLLGEYLDWRCIDFYRLDGSTSLDERRERMNSFNREDRVKVFILSTRAGGLGVNLQTADTVIIFDSDFNPQMDLQAQDRAHRVGQKNQVRVFRLITLTPIEELILNKAYHKLDLDSKIIQAGMFNRQASDEDRRERLRSLFTGTRSDDKSNGTGTTPAEINRMMARTTQEFIDFQERDFALFDGFTSSIVTCNDSVIEQASANTRITLQKLTAQSNGSSGLLFASGRLMNEDEVPEWVKGPVETADNEGEIAQELTREMRKSRGEGLGAVDKLSDREWIKMVLISEGDVPPIKKRRVLERPNKPGNFSPINTEESQGVADLEEGDRIRLRESGGYDKGVAEVDVLTRRDITLRWEATGVNEVISVSEFGRRFRWELEP